jgi:hypothetical protein
MPSIFEKPSILGFRAEGGDTSANADQIKLLGERLAEARQKAVTEQQKNELAALEKRFAELSYVVRAEPPVSVPMAGPGSMMRPPMPTLQQRETAMREIEGLMPQLEQLRNPQGSGRGASGSWEESGGVTPAPVAPAATPSLFADAAAALAAANETYEAEANALPPSPSMFSAPPAGSRAANIAAAKASGDFGAKQRQYNQEAMRMGHPSMMDDQGNIVGRELTQEEQMRDAFMRTGGNTPFLQTNDPMQRALQNEMMKQARGQIAANTFGFTDDERKKNLMAEAEARRILATPLGGGQFINGGQVNDIAPGVRAAFRNGQAVGIANNNQAPLKGPNGESTATMNDPLDKYITNPDGSVSLNRNPKQLNMAQFLAGDEKIALDKGMTGGSPIDLKIFAAMAAEEERKKKEAARAESAKQGAIMAPQIASNIARGFSPGAQVGGFFNDAMQQARK